MKKYKSPTKNRGTTIILENCEEAITVTDHFLVDKNGMQKMGHYWYDYDNGADLKSKWNQCKDAITKGDLNFKKLVDDIVENLLGTVDDIHPIFAQQKQGYERTDGESGVATNPELLMQGEELCAFKQKFSAEKKLKQGAGEGAYRILINTDVSWRGRPEDNCGLVAALILLLQRYAPVEVWIQQGWLGSNPTDGVTLFKLDYTACADITSLAFWITHRWKDSVFSFLVNRALNRKDYATSGVAEIECDLMLRGDWFKSIKISLEAIYKASIEERQKMMAQWIAHTGYNIVYEQEGPEITDI